MPSLNRLNQIPKSGSGMRKAGNRGEDRAVEYLLERGYTIVCRNYQSRNGEIDCIVRDPDGTLVFVEVKSSMAGTCGDPMFRINAAKQRKLLKTARQYLAEHNISFTPCRFDVVSVKREGVEHLRNAIIAM